MSPKINERKKQ